MIKPELKERLRCMLSPYWNDIHDYVDELDDIIDNCDDQEDREDLSVAIDHINLAIVNMEKVLNRKNKEEK